MSLNIPEWKPFFLKNIFNIKYGVNLELNGCEEVEVKNDSNVNFVSRTGDNNGVSSRVTLIDGVKPQKAGLISIAGGGSVLSTFLQNEPFYSGRDLYVLECKETVSDKVKLFLVTVIEQNKYKYSYGRQANKTMPFLEIMLPIKKNSDGTPFIDKTHKYSKEGYVPDWEFMEDYIKSLHHKPLTTSNKEKTCKSLETEMWKEFVFTDVFKLKGGFYNKKPEHSIDGEIPFLSSTENNNGVTEYYSIDDIESWDKNGNEDDTLDKKIYKGNCIAVTVNGSVCNAFYQIDDFTCSHDITAFYLKGHKMNSYLAMFLCTIIMQDKYRWSYGRKPHDVKKFGKSTIKLPILYNEDGTPFIDKAHKYSKEGYVPDWEFMEDYIKSMPYGDRLSDIRNQY